MMTHYKREQGILVVVVHHCSTPEVGSHSNEHPAVYNRVIMQIKGAVALVTGAAKGIGYAFSEALLEHGAASVST